MNEGLLHTNPVYFDFERVERESLRVIDRSKIIPYRRPSKFVARIPSAYKGVSFDRSRNKFEAYVGGGKIKRVRLGRFDTAEQANNAVIEYTT